MGCVSDDVTVNMRHTSPVVTIAKGRGCGTMDGDGKHCKQKEYCVCEKKNEEKGETDISVTNDVPCPLTTLQTSC